MYFPSSASPLDGHGIAGARRQDGVGQQFEHDGFERTVIESGAAGAEGNPQIGRASGGACPFAAGAFEAARPVFAGLARTIGAEFVARGQLGDEIEAAHLLS